MGGVCISDTRGTLPGTLYSGVHFIAPLGEHVQTFDLRDKVFTTAMPGEQMNPSTSAKERGPKPEEMTVQSKEGLEHRARDCGPLPARSAQAGLCAVASAAAAGHGTGGPGGR